MPQGTVFVLVLRGPAAVQQHGEHTGKQQAEDKAQHCRAPTLKRDRNFHRQAQDHALNGIVHLPPKVGPCIRAEPGNRALQIIVFPQQGDLGVDLVLHLFQPLDERQSRSKGRVVLGQNGCKAQAGERQRFAVFLHFRAKAAIVQVFRHAVGQIAHAFQQGLGLAARNQHGVKHLAQVKHRGRDAAADGLNGVGPVFIRIEQHQQTPRFFHEGLNLLAQIG